MEARRKWIIALALAAACLLVYSQAARFGFLNFDDNPYVTENPHVRSGLTAPNIAWAFGTIDYFYWQPLTWISHMLDCQLFGLNPGAHHLTNVLLHTLNALLVFAVFRRLTGTFWRSALLAAVWAIHPLRIESVAWIAERKDLLSAFWFLATIWLYLRYVERPSRGRYYTMLGAFVLGLMAKPMAMTLPFILLLLDYWPLRRRAFAEKFPLIGFAVLSTLITSLGTGRLGI
ncbi:MAG TPA: glycosyltransferase family 39 protein, partial [Thermoanaerobaculia bacterium]